MSEQDNPREYLYPSLDIPGTTQNKRNESYLSPDHDGARTPPRILSNQNLAGEDFVSSSRLLDAASSDQVDVELSPFTPSEATNTPPSSLQMPTSLSLSPPPLNLSNNDYSSQLDLQQQSGQSASKQQQTSTNGSKRPPRVPHVAVHPTTTRNNNLHETPRQHGRVQSNTDYSFLSALTESSSESTVPKRRTVSWDMNDPTVRMTRVAGSPGAKTQATHKSTPASILQPILLEDTQRVAPPDSIFATNYVKELAKQQSNNHREPPSMMKASEGNCAATLQADNLGVADTGSFVLTSDFARDAIMYTPPPRKQHHKTHSKRYSLQDVLNATPIEPEDEIQCLKEIDALEAKPHNYNKSLLPLVTEDRIHDFHEENDETKKTPVEDTKQHSGKESLLDNFSSLTKKLMEMSPPQKSKGSMSSPGRKQYAGEKMAEAAANLFKSDGSSAALKRLESFDVEHGQDSTNVCQEEKKTFRDRFFKYRRGAVDVGRRLKGDVEYFVEFLEPSKATIRQQFFKLLRFVFLPCLAVAALLFYACGNPPTGRNPVNNDIASASWWILFVGVRQVITLELARFSQLIVIDFLTFRTKFFPRILGTALSLTIAQSKGWPFQLLAWAFIDLLMLTGDGSFAHHWAYWQNFVDMMNASNPSGYVTSSDTYHKLLYVSMGMSVAVSIKRSMLGHVVGKRVVGEFR
jgi:hypothetical protein